MRKVLMAGALACLLPGAASAAGFSLTSPDVKPGARIGADFVFNSFGCTGKNVSPALSWSGAPAGTKSFVLTVFDPDAPTGSGFWHWVVYDIPAATTSLPRGAGAAGGAAPGKTAVDDYGIAGYGGPCPPAGAKPHRYVFTLYAIKAESLGAPDKPSPAVVGFLTHFARIGQASFTALYGR